MADVKIVSQVEDGTRLMRWFGRHYPSLSNAEFHKLCRGGQIRLNSSRVRGTEVLRSGDAIRVPPTISGYTHENTKKTESGDKFSLSDLEQLRTCIIHNDDDIVVFDKPAGLSVQGGTGIRKSIDKMATAMFPYAKISLVHRLDKETSGVLVVAKSQRAAQALASEFQSKTAHKEYLALLNGGVKKKQGVIDNYIAKGQVFDTAPRTKDGTNGRPQRAITEYEVLATAGCVSWVLFRPKTGRTHQLRVHSALCLNAPIVGDDLYGRKKRMDAALKAMLTTNNLHLLAYRLTFRHPTNGKVMTFCARVPDFMKPVMKFLELPLP